MKELLATNNAVTISYIRALLQDSDIHYLVLDQNMSILEGSLGVIPQRIMVEEGLLAVARGLIEDAGLGAELTTDINR